jgi:hypothetical protein
MDRLETSVYGVDSYHLFTDQYHSSVQLAQEVVNRKYQIGTITAGRVGNPKPVRQGAMKKMKSGDTCAHRSGNVLIMGWKDKRTVLMMSTYHDTSMEKMVTIQNGDQQKEIQKPILCT